MGKTSWGISAHPDYHLDSLLGTPGVLEVIWCTHTRSYLCVPTMDNSWRVTPWAVTYQESTNRNWVRMCCLFDTCKQQVPFPVQKAKLALVAAWLAPTSPAEQSKSWNPHPRSRLQGRNWAKMQVYSIFHTESKSLQWKNSRVEEETTHAGFKIFCKRWHCSTLLHPVLSMLLVSGHKPNTESSVSLFLSHLLFAYLYHAHRDKGIKKSHNGWDWKGLLEVIWSRPLKTYRFLRIQKLLFFKRFWKGVFRFPWEGRPEGYLTWSPA